MTYRQRYYRTRKDAGLCPRCGKNKIELHQGSCEVCRLERRDWYNKLRESGLCICGNQAVTGRAACEKCLEDRKKYKRDRRGSRIGKCKNCENAPREGKRTCLDCFLEKKECTKQKEIELNKSGLCRCGRVLAKGYKTKCDDCLSKNRELTRNIKVNTFNAYGGFVCSCCGEKEESFLSIDHVNNDGAELRRKGQGTSITLYRWLRDHNYPEGYQVLCFNCQMGKRKCGICPHKRSV